MFFHPVSWIGYLGVLLTLFVLVIWDSVAQPSRAFAAILFILPSVSMFLILLGVVARGFSRIEKYLSGHPQMRAGWEASRAKPEFSQEQYDAANPWKRNGKNKVDPS